MGGTDAVHLACADSRDTAARRHGDGVGAHVFADCHRQFEVLHLLSSRGLFGHHVQFIVLKTFAVKGLAEQTAGHADIHPLVGIRLVGAEGHQPDVLLGGEMVEGLLRERGREDDFEEDGLHCLGGRQVDLAVGGHDSAEDGDAVGLVSAGPSFQGVRAESHTAGVLVLHGHHRRAIELTQNLQRGVCILYIIVRKLLAVQLFGPGHRESLFLAGIEGRFLMRVLAVAQRLPLGEGKRQILRKFLTSLLCQVGRDVGVVGGRVAEDLGGQTAAGLQRGVAVGTQLFQNGGVIIVIDHHGDECVVFGRAAQHRGSADVYILDGVLKRSPLSLNGLLERIEVHHHHVDGGDAVGFHLLDMLGVRAHGEESAVHFGVQGLHAPVHNLGKARHLADADGGNTRSLQRLARAACGYNLKS